MAKKLKYTGSSKIILALCNVVNELIDSGGGSTVTITPTVNSGTKIAGYTINSVSGSLYAPDSASGITYANTSSGMSATNVQSAIDEIARDFTDGCDVIVSAVTAKGQTPISNSPSDIAAAIGDIQTGPDVSEVDALATDVMTGKKYVDSSGVLVTGTMPDNGAVSVTITSGQTYTVPLGYHNGLGMVTVSGGGGYDDFELVYF